MEQELGHTGICRWEEARIQGVFWPRLGMPSMSNSCPGQIPNITSVKGGGCAVPQVGLSLPAMTDVKILVREAIQKKWNMYCKMGAIAGME